MMKRLVLLMWLLATFVNPDLFSQSKSEIKKKFYDAEVWILFEDYQEALPKFEELLTINPVNSNYKYRIGQCYINIPGAKEQAISYLEDAVKNINPKYKEGKFRETRAPHDAYYYLANAYRINNQLDKAIETYEIFKANLNPKIYDSVIVNLQIQSCCNARELMTMPLFIKQQNLGNLINESRSEFNPVISDNEEMLVFARSEALYDGIFYSVKRNGQWSVPLNMNDLLNVDENLFPTSISKDGKDLYLYSTANYDGIIYVSHFESEFWSPIIELNGNINTKYWESHATISHDDNSLFFTSNRRGTIGGLDIYISRRDSTGDWGPAENLGPVINTPYNEESPFLSLDDKTLFFSSRGHFNMGGYDIFYSSQLDNNEWSVPMNVGYPLNTTDDDVFFKPLNDGYEGYYAKESSDGFGQQDIYRIEIFSDNHPRKFFVRGMVKAADLIDIIKDSMKVSALNIKDPNQTVVIYSNPETGEYELELPQGNYQLTYEGDGVETVVKNLDLPLANPSDSFVLPETVLPKTDFVADLNIESNQTVSVAKGDSILFPLKVEPNSLLTVEHWMGDSLMSVEQYFISDSTFNYKIAPGVGDNKVVFKLTDKFNNATTADVSITREKDVAAQPVIRPEYRRVIAQKQIDALTEMLNNRSNDDIKKVVADADIDKQQFGKADDLISYLRDKASDDNINSEELDKLALRVAVMDNVLTQAAVDYMAKYSEGDLKTILSDLDIYEADLKTWTDLQQYILNKTGGQITPEETNRIASNILSEADPAISVIREKILAFSENSESGDIIRQSVAAVDTRNIKLAEKWLLAFYNESINQGLTKNQMSEILAVISSYKDTKVEQFLADLIENSDEPLHSSLKSINLKREKIKSPEDLISNLLMNEDLYPEEALSKAMANLISSEDVPEEEIKSHFVSTEKTNLWFLWIILGTGLFLSFLILWRRKKKKTE